jgi:hypothetical protein
LGKGYPAGHIKLVHGEPIGTKGSEIQNFPTAIKHVKALAVDQVFRLNKNEIHDIPAGGFIARKHKKSQHQVTAEIFFITHFVFYPLQCPVSYTDALRRKKIFLGHRSLLDPDGHVYTGIWGYYFSQRYRKSFFHYCLLNGIVFLLVMLPFTFIQFFYAPWLEEQNKARAPRTVPDTLSNHVILTHYDNVAANLIEKFTQYSIPYVILVQDLSQALELHDLGYHIVVGDLDNPDL